MEASPRWKITKQRHHSALYGALQQVQYKTAGGGDWRRDPNGWDENSFALGVEVEMTTAGLEFWVRRCWKPRTKSQTLRRHSCYGRTKRYWEATRLLLSWKLIPIALPGTRLFVDMPRTWCSPGVFYICNLSNKENRERRPRARLWELEVVRIGFSV
jgi:hypothetical protein